MKPSNPGSKLRMLELVLSLIVTVCAVISTFLR